MRHLLGPLGNYYTQITIFLFGALALTVPSGYSVSAALLFVGGLLCLLTHPALRHQLKREDYWLVIVFIGYAAVGIFNVWFHDSPSRYFDKPIRFLLAPLGLFLLLRFRPRPSFWWAGIACGSIMSGLWAIEQRFFLDIERALGHTNAIQYGNLSMLLGLWCLAALLWAAHRPRHRLPWIIILTLGALFGVMASLLSGSRGGWIGLPLVLLVFYRAYSDQIRKKTQIVIGLIILIACISVYLSPSLGVQQRIHEAYDDIYAYWTLNNPVTSIGLRFEMWKVAAQLIREQPLLGWGDYNYPAQIHALIEAGQAHPALAKFNHPHNELLNSTTKYGLPGLLALLALYFLPLKLFASGLHHSCYQQRALAVAGTLLAVCFFDFGLTQAFLAHNSGTMVYAFATVLIWGIYRSAQPQP